MTSLGTDVGPKPERLVPKGYIMELFLRKSSSLGDVD